MSSSFFSNQALLLPAYKVKHSKELWGRLGLEEAQKNLVSFFCVCFCFIQAFVYAFAPDVNSRTEQPSCGWQSRWRGGRAVMSVLTQRSGYPVQRRHCPHSPPWQHLAFAGIWKAIPALTPSVWKTAWPPDGKRSYVWSDLPWGGQLKWNYWMGLTNRWSWMSWAWHSPASCQNTRSVPLIISCTVKLPKPTGAGLINLQRVK